LKLNPIACYLELLPGRVAPLDAWLVVGASAIFWSVSSCMHMEKAGKIPFWV